jgi:Holliday junction resolvase RusA-like endonuclease
MNDAPIKAAFFVKKDGVLLAPLKSLEGKSEVSLFVRGAPRAAPRPRAGRNAVYHDNSADAWMSQVTMNYVILRRAPLTGPVELNLQFLFDRPKKDAVRFWKDSKPDIDNLEKAVMDALTRARAWKDDAQVVQMQSLKRYALPDEPSGVHIEIVTLDTPALKEVMA